MRRGCVGSALRLTQPTECRELRACCRPDRGCRVRTARCASASRAAARKRASTPCTSPAPRACASPSPRPAQPPRPCCSTPRAASPAATACAIEVTLAAGCSATVTSAAAEKIYRSLEGDAEIRVDLGLDDGARLPWLPQPTIVFDRARLDRRTDVAMSAGATLLAVGVPDLRPRRHGRGRASRCCPRRLARQRDGRLVFADTLLVDGPVAGILDRGATLDGARATALLFMPRRMLRPVSTRCVRFCKMRPAQRGPAPGTTCSSCAPPPATAARCRRTWSR